MASPRRELVIESKKNAQRDQSSSRGNKVSPGGRGVIEANATLQPWWPPAGRAVRAAAYAILTCLATFSLIGTIITPSAAVPTYPRALLHRTRAAASSLLQVFQVYPPVLTVAPNGTLEITDGSSNATVDIVDVDSTNCHQTLTVHTFANSYGSPFVGNYTPPACSFNRVTWNLTVTVAGVQFDRLGIVYLGDVEVFRTSTAEPTTNGVEWTYLKDMTSYLALFREDQKLIFDLPNIVNSQYTGELNVVLTAAYFTAEDSVTPADVVLPVSARMSTANMGSVFTVPPNVASNALTLPRNVKRAVFTVAATGQQAEEFWWSNVLQSETNTFPQSGAFYGYSPFREVQLAIDGQLAGVAWPFPIIFTGGVVPGLWRPIVGIDAYDLKEDEIDITPWLPLLCDGQAHNFTIRVSGLNDNGNGTATLSETTDSYWLVTGKVFIWLDKAGHITTGRGPNANTPAPSLTVSSSIGKTANGTLNDTLQYSVSAQRTLSFQSTLNLASGPSTAIWSQSLTFSNVGNLTDQGNTEINTQLTTGYDLSSSGYARHFTYPLYALSTLAYPNADNISIFANINRSKTVDTLGTAVFPTGLESFAAAEQVHPLYPSFQGSALATTQNGTATYIANLTAGAAYSFGSTSQQMTFSGLAIDGPPTPGFGVAAFPPVKATYELFERNVAAVNGSVTYDEETLVNEEIPHRHGFPPAAGGAGAVLSQVLPARGPRWRGISPPLSG